MLGSGFLEYGLYTRRVMDMQDSKKISELHYAREFLERVNDAGACCWISAVYEEHRPNCPESRQLRRMIPQE